MATGRISDPFVADNELSVQWVADADWTYRRTFEPSQELLDSERVELVCDGLDTLAEDKTEWKPGGHSQRMHSANTAGRSTNTYDPARMNW